MLGKRAVAACAAVAALVVLASCAKEEPKTAAAPAMSPVERGEYLAWVTGCHDCHTPGGMYGTPDMSRKLSGSELGWEGPWGVTYPRNLTPDPGTGIAAWSEADIVTAIRTGKRPDGTAIQPPMPWPDFSHLTDEDAMALAAYLKSLPPVTHKAPDRLAPGVKFSGAALSMPAPPAWDTPRTQ
jgi:mono/diheme cytochrome c family protein